MRGKSTFLLTSMKSKASTVFLKTVLIQSVVPVAIFFCLPSAFAGISSNRSILESSDSDPFRINAFGGSNDSFSGALTLDNVYHFDFATAGIGSVTFRARSNRAFGIPADEITREMPRDVGGWTSQGSSFENTNFFTTEGFHQSARYSLAFADQTDSDLFPNVPLVPEPGTWAGAALALAAIGFTQRRRLRGLIRRHA